jgi:RNA methyltransferase, TrmH family
MSAAAFSLVSSRDNALIKDIRRLIAEPTAYRRLGRFWMEGDHLCRAAVQKGFMPKTAIFSQSFWALCGVEWSSYATKNVVVPDSLYAEMSGLGSASGLGFLFDLLAEQEIQANLASVVLDRVQDSGNVGSVLRSAAAFGFSQVIALKGSAALYSPKVLRAGMGAHFSLKLIESVEPASLGRLNMPLVVTSSHEGEFLHDLASDGRLPSPCAWVLGHEGQGVDPLLVAQSGLSVRIAQPGGEESLNVAAAAAICLHASATSAAAAGRPPL